MTKEEVLQVFRDTGALLEGHFILRSGLHSRQFFQCALALQQMPIVEKLGAALAAKVEQQRELRTADGSLHRRRLELTLTTTIIMTATIVT